MRFDSSHDSEQASASDLVNTASILELTQIIKRFGDERFAPVIAEKIIEARQGTLISTTGELKTAISKAFAESGHLQRNKAIKRAF